MRFLPWRYSFWRPLAAGVLTVALSLGFFVGVTKAWRADPRVPFCYDGDGLMVLLWAKSLCDGAWYLHNDYVGAPGGLDFHDFPLADNLHFGLLKLLCLATHDYGLAVNFQFLLTFPLTAVIGLFVLRCLRRSYPTAILGGLLFAFLPYHFLRGHCHLFLASYFLVPMTALLAHWVYLERPWSRRRVFGSIAVCALTASSGLYYAFFGAYLIVIAGLACAWRCRRWRPLAIAIGFCFLIGFGVTLNILPTLLYQRQHGPNPEALDRRFEHAEVFGLKVAQLLLPTTGHRVPWLADLKARYNATPELLVNENDHASLGLFGSIGFLALLAGLFVRKRPALSRDRWSALVVLNAAALLLATTGGFGAVFNLLVGPWIRCYNRMSVYLAFFAIAALCQLLDAARRRVGSSFRVKSAFAGIAVLLTLLGVLDQTGTTPEFKPLYGRLKQRFERDAALIAPMEETLPAGSMIFQLPYVPFPEQPLVEGMGGYELLRGYLHSRTLRWSYGAMKGRDTDLWQRAVADRPAHELITVLFAAGFNGFMIDRAFFSDGAAKLESEIAYVLGRAPFTSADSRYAFFDLTPYRSEHHGISSEVLSPILVRWENGCGPLEGSSERNFRWCAARAELTLLNTTGRERIVVLEVRAETAERERSMFWIEGPLLTATMELNSAGANFSRTIAVPPGRHSIQFLCGCNRAYAQRDPRRWVFKVTSLRVRDVVR